ncbi:hypothetical protein V7S43_008560 [Phytophthora oleae]|uniref:B box-type domain-containing protein n=1 Tax=Phytophthora oleae TaxID=2107226 RepID=A0ABD3FHR2_9STRA
MEILHDDFRPELDDNQTLSSCNIKSDEYEVEEGEIAVSTSETNTESVTQSVSFPPRKVHSASPASNGFGIDEFLDGIPRPYTSAGTDDFRSSSSLVPRHSKKKSAAARKNTAKDNKTPREERPRSADVNEWGDFDTDRLLRGDFKDLSNQMPLEPQDGQRTRSRKSRRSTPTTSSPCANPWEGYITLNNESKELSRPHLQVLRQKTIDILTLDLVQSSQPSGKASATPKPLVGRASFQKLMSPSSRPVTSHASRPATPTPLFGTEVPNTPKNRLTIFARFGNLWSLISRNSGVSPVDQFAISEASDTEANPFDADTRSPFECSMTMVKICKTVGISLTPSAATHLSFWYTNDQGVDFTAFCDLVIQGAIQPALHHFNLDNSIDEYVSALDTIVQSLVTTESARRRSDKVVPPEYPRRLKELNEIQPVFMSWKAGIMPRLVQSDEDPTPPPTRALITAEKVRRALEASASQHMLAHQLPIEEARVTHVENIRRKVQLHKSWKFSAEGKLPLERGISSSLGQISRGLTSSRDQRIPTSQTAELAEMLNRARTVFPTSAGADKAFPRDRPEFQSDSAAEATDATPEMETEAESDEVLVCCSCSVRCAELWCSSCFTVSCQKCWQEIHSCTVDMSMVLSSSGKSLVGPTALAMKQKRSTLGPPVAMVYLPTKAIAAGALAKGNCIVRHKSGKRKSSNQAISRVTDEIPSVVANAILPSLRKSQSTGTVIRHHERPQLETIASPSTDSTADLVKSLMMRMAPSSTPSTANRTTRSHTSLESAMRMHKHHQPPRPKLHLAPVSLDAELLFSQTFV